MDIHLRIRQMLLQMFRHGIEQQDSQMSSDLHALHRQILLAVAVLLAETVRQIFPHLRDRLPVLIDSAELLVNLVRDVHRKLLS